VTKDRALGTIAYDKAGDHAHKKD